MGQSDSALGTLAVLLRANPTWREYVGNHYWFRTLQQNPRFVALTKDSAR
jgi:hypothetical protein